MSEAAAIAQPATAPPGLDALATTAWTLEPPMPREVKHVLRDEAGFLLDGLLVRLARGRGALDVAIGEGLDALGVGSRLIALGFSSVGDYAYEKLGMQTGMARKMARLARKLRERPLLREAVRRGEVSARKAETIVPVARGEDEAGWVARARTDTVRALAAAVNAESASGPEEDERWERIVVPLEPEQRARVEEAMDLAGKVLGATTPRWQRLETIAQEFLGAHPVETTEDERADVALRAEVSDWLSGAKEWLEKEMANWSFLEKVEPVASPPGSFEGMTDPHEIDRELRQRAATRERWDEVFGHVAMLLRMLGLWRDMGFAKFAHYCEERLGMAERTVSQRASLERKLYELPALRAAMREGRISYEKARLVASCADDDSVDSWIDRARGMTCIDLRRKIEEDSEAQMCARGDLDLRVPVRVRLLLGAAFQAAREAAGEHLNEGECLVRMAEHFIETWKGARKQRNTVRNRALVRDRGLCQVPGCSRAAWHGHHVRFKSRGGGEEEENRASLCPVHHLLGIHGGYMRVSGRAPAGLVWQLVTPAGLVPFGPGGGSGDGG